MLPVETDTGTEFADQAPRSDQRTSGTGGSGRSGRLSNLSNWVATRLASPPDGAQPNPAHEPDCQVLPIRRAEEQWCPAPAGGRGVELGNTLGLFFGQFIFHAIDKGRGQDDTAIVRQHLAATAQMSLSLHRNCSSRESKSNPRKFAGRSPRFFWPAPPCVRRHAALLTAHADCKQSRPHPPRPGDQRHHPEGRVRIMDLFRHMSRSRTPGDRTAISKKGFDDPIFSEWNETATSRPPTLGLLGGDKQAHQFAELLLKKFAAPERCGGPDGYRRHARAPLRRRCRRAAAWFRLALCYAPSMARGGSRMTLLAEGKDGIARSVRLRQRPHRPHSDPRHHALSTGPWS